MRFPTHRLVVPALLLMAPLSISLAIAADVPQADPLQPAAAANNAVRDAQLAARLLNYTNRNTKSFRPILSNELSFIRQVCDIPRQQRPKIKAAGEEKLLEQAKRYAQYQLRRSGGAAAAPGNSAPPNYRENIVKGLTKVLNETLPADQFARYTEEFERRAANRKRAAILTVVSQLDGALYLSDAQRKEIAESLSENWRPRWEDWMLVRRYGDQVFPAVPDQFLVSHLNAEQTAIWRRVQKIDLVNISAQEEVQTEENDGWWGDERDVPPPEPQVKIEDIRGQS